MRVTNVIVVLSMYLYSTGAKVAKSNVQKHTLLKYSDTQKCFYMQLPGNGRTDL